VYPPQGDLLLIHPSDREYVLQELTAFFLSWLHALPGPVLNRPTPQSLCGRPRSLVEWLWLAKRAGLPIPRYRQSNQDTVGWHALHVRLRDAGPDLRTLVVVRESVVGESAPPPIEEGCRRLGVLSGTGLLGVELTVRKGGAWEFAGSTCLPDLRLGGEMLLDVLAAKLCEQRGGGS